MLEHGPLTGAPLGSYVAGYLVGIYHDGSPSGQGLPNGGLAGAESTCQANPQHV